MGAHWELVSHMHLFGCDSQSDPRSDSSPCLLRSLSLMMCLWRARAIALDSLGLSSRAGMVTGSGGASCVDVHVFNGHRKCIRRFNNVYPHSEINVTGRYSTDKNGQRPKLAN